MKISHFALIGFAVLHAIFLCAGYLAPYEPSAQNRQFPSAPPTKIHWQDKHGQFHLRPFVYGIRTNPEEETYSEDPATQYPLHFFLSGHLFGVEQTGRIFLLGSDAFGRDLLSRILYGGRLSIAAGLLAVLITLVVGTLLGAVAGMAGGLVDSVIMRFAELGLALSWFYLLLAIRAFLPLRTPPVESFFLVAGVLGLTGWARPARLIRGAVLSAKERSFVMSARGFGAKQTYLFRRHIVPQILPLLLTQAIVLVPQFIMAEVTLSFLGLGASEPLASWGNLLADLQQYHVLTSDWWICAPLFALVLTSSTYFLIINWLRKQVPSVV